MIFIKLIILARCQWLKPIILVTQKAEIRRLQFEASPRKKNSRDPISKIPNTKKGLAEWLWLWSACLANTRA
jgi:hypothetical protein